MKWSGWLFMLGSWAAILGLFAYCMARTLRSGRGNDDSQTRMFRPDD